MADDIYVLDLCVTGADAVSFFDDGTGTDTIRVNGVYAAIIDIHLGWTVVDGVPINTFGRYVSADNRGHQLLINGMIENAFGSNGSELITGNELANDLGGDQKRSGAGLSDTLMGGGGADRIYGGSGDDSVEGNAENDLMYGDAGNDEMWGGTGDDTMLGGSGADRLDGGGNAGDTLSYAESKRGVRVSISAEGLTTGHRGDAEGDQISGFEKVIGTRRKDVIDMANKESLPGGHSNNMVDGGGGRDRITMGGGNDQAMGGKGSDLIYGENGDDLLSGDAGSDRLVGGYGRDFLKGGSGADRFVFVAAGDSTVDRSDVITDFSTAQGDRIDLRTIDADTTVAGKQGFTLIDGLFSGSAGELQATRLGSDLTIAADRDGDGLADFAIVLRDVATVSTADFVL